MNTYLRRVSIRKWTNQIVEYAKLNSIFQAAMAAPSAGNQQPWEFYVVNDKATLEKLAACSPYAGCVANAPVAIVNVCRSEGVRFPEVAEYDMAICTEHEWLKATELGLGAVWICVAPFEDRIAKANEAIGLGEGEGYVYSILPLGYPDEAKFPQDRFDASRIHWPEII